MPNEERPPQTRQLLMPNEERPPQTRQLLFASAGGGFGGALLAIIIAKVLAGPACCCPNQGAYDHADRDAAVIAQPARQTDSKK